MKAIFRFILILITAAGTYAQTNPLPGYIWKIKQQYAEFIGSKYFYYHKDSSVNILDHSSTEYAFLANGSYTAIDTKSNISFTGKWNINAKRDSISLDGRPKFLYLLDPQNLIMRTHALQYADTSARIDTVFTYLHLYPSRSIVTGLEESGNYHAFSIVPNPATGSNIRLEFTSPQSEPNGQVMILSLDNREIYRNSIRIDAGLNTAFFDIPSSTPSGIYMVKIKTSTFVHSGKLILTE